MINVRPNPTEVEESIHIGSALLLNDDDPAKMLRIIEECAADVVKTENPEDLSGFSYGLLFSKFRALGILVTRGAIPVVPQKTASELFEEILKARDQLNLPPDDPFSDIIDQRFARHEEDERAEAVQLRKARQNLEAKAQEVRQLKESLAQLQKEITRREKKNTVTNAPAMVTATGDEAALKELRNKVESLKDALKERHHERNDLRRELQKTSSDLEALRQNEKATPAQSDAHDDEDELLLPQDAVEIHPVRLIEFPKNFQQTLAAFPRHVARAAMIMIGRLAAGEPAAFVGALRLKAMSNVMRQRIGSDFRLLFRLCPDRVQVIDLINRKDLDRRIKTLASSKL